MQEADEADEAGEAEESKDNSQEADEAEGSKGNLLAEGGTLREAHDVWTTCHACCIPAPPFPRHLQDILEEINRRHRFE